MFFKCLETKVSGKYLDLRGDVSVNTHNEEHYDTCIVQLLLLG